jgi:cell wall assembly regulator SMI1/ankyrin repeat protein
MAKKRDLVEEAATAILRGEHQALQALLEAGVPVNSRLKWGETLLHYAVDEGHTKIATTLIAAGADVNARDQQFKSTPLMKAAGNGRLEFVRAMLAAGADASLENDFGITALGRASSGRKGTVQVEIAKALLKAGASPHGNPLIGASPEIINVLVKAGADPNEDTRWGLPLFRAVQDNRPDCVTALLAAGADPAKPYPPCDSPLDGKSALDLARELKKPKIVALLEAAAVGGKKSGSKKTTPKPKPPTTSDIPALWDRIKAALKQRGPKVLKALQRGATEAQLKKLEKTCGCKLPADFRAAYKLHNGQKPSSQPLLPDEFTWGDYELLTIDGILREWKSWKELIDINEFKGQKSTPDKGIRSDWWHPGWIPFAANGGGDSICLDLAPAKCGTIGQVITMNHDNSERLVLAKSLAEYLAKLAEHWEQ